MSKPVQSWHISYTNNEGKVCDGLSNAHTLPHYKPWRCSMYDCIAYLMDHTVDDRDSNKPMNCKVYYYRNIYLNKEFQGMKHTGYIEISVLKNTVTITMQDDSYIRRLYDKS